MTWIFLFLVVSLLRAVLWILMIFLSRGLEKAFLILRILAANAMTYAKDFVGLVLLVFLAVQLV